MLRGLIRWMSQDSDLLLLLGFIGLGAMAEPMTLNPIKTDTSLLFWNCSPAKRATPYRMPPATFSASRKCDTLAVAR